MALSSRWLVSSDWLAKRLGNPDVVVVDGSYYLATAKRDARQEYLAEHIPGAMFFDIDAIADDSTDLPHMLPGPTAFGETVGALGIGRADTIVVYDGAGLYSAARVWWTFRLFGAEKAYISTAACHSGRPRGVRLNPAKSCARPASSRPR